MVRGGVERSGMNRSENTRCVLFVVRVGNQSTELQEERASTHVTTKARGEATPAASSMSKPLP